jgi:hypothetical protein
MMNASDYGRNKLDSEGNIRNHALHPWLAAELTTSA